MADVIRLGRGVQGVYLSRSGGTVLVPYPGPPGPKGKDGADLTPEQFDALVQTTTEEVQEDLEPTVPLVLQFENALT